jgi:hypothetical protein
MIGVASWSDPSQQQSSPTGRASLVEATLPLEKADEFIQVMEVKAMPAPNVLNGTSPGNHLTLIIHSLIPDPNNE